MTGDEHRAAVRARVIATLEALADELGQEVDEAERAALRLAGHLMASSPPPLHDFPEQLEGWVPDAQALAQRARTGL